MSVAQIWSEDGFLNARSVLPVDVAVIAHSDRFVDGEPGLHAISIEAVDDPCVVPEPLYNEGIGPTS